MDDLFADVLPRFPMLRSSNTAGDTKFLQKTLQRDLRAQALRGLTQNEYRTRRERTDHVQRIRCKAAGAGASLVPKGAFPKDQVAHLTPAPHKLSKQMENTQGARATFEQKTRDEQLTVASMPAVGTTNQRSLLTSYLRTASVIGSNSPETPNFEMQDVWVDVNEASRMRRLNYVDDGGPAGSVQKEKSSHRTSYAQVPRSASAPPELPTGNSPAPQGGSPAGGSRSKMGATTFMTSTLEDIAENHETTDPITPQTTDNPQRSWNDLMNKSPGPVTPAMASTQRSKSSLLSYSEINTDDLEEPPVGHTMPPVPITVAARRQHYEAGALSRGSRGAEAAKAAAVRDAARGVGTEGARHPVMAGHSVGQRQPPYISTRQFHPAHILKGRRAGQVSDLSRLVEIPEESGPTYAAGYSPVAIERPITRGTVASTVASGLSEFNTPEGHQEWLSGQANENEVDAAEYLPSVLGRASTQTWAPTAGDYQPVVWH